MNGTIYGPFPYMHVITTDQSHSPEHGDAVDALDGEVDEAGHHDDEVEDVPAAGEVVLAQRHQLQHRLQREEAGEDLVAHVQYVLEVLAHAVVLRGQEGRVEDDAEGDGGVEQHVVHHQEERVLEAQPQVVVQAELAAARAVAVVGRLCKQRRRERIIGGHWCDQVDGGQQ